MEILPRRDQQRFTQHVNAGCHQIAVDACNDWSAVRIDEVPLVAELVEGVANAAMDRQIGRGGDGSLDKRVLQCRQGETF